MVESFPFLPICSLPTSTSNCSVSYRILFFIFFTGQQDQGQEAEVAAEAGLALGDAGDLDQDLEAEVAAGAGASPKAGQDHAQEHQKKKLQHHAQGHGPLQSHQRKNRQKKRVMNED